jgi:D-threo-aldose 1-dehydrogenase
VIDYTADGVRRSVEDSLQRLALGHIDIAYVHDLSPDMFGKEFEHHYRIAAGKGGAFEAWSGCARKASSRPGAWA